MWCSLNYGSVWTAFPGCFFRWLAEWLLENNPNKPKVAHGDDQLDGGEDGDKGGGGETALWDGPLEGMVGTVESRLQE